MERLTQPPKFAAPNQQADAMIYTFLDRPAEEL